MTDDKAQIPDILKDCRFIIVGKKKKEAFEKKWQIENNYSIDDQKLIHALKTGYNYGVMPSGNVGILDADEPDILQELGLLEQFNDTFTVKSGGGEKYHFYFETDEGIGNKKIVLSHPETEEHLGELYPPGCPAYCVGAGSVHPSGKPYIIFKDLPLKYIPSKDINSILEKCKKKGKQEQPKRDPIDWSKHEGSKDTLTNIVGLRIEDIAYPSGKVVINGDEIQGSHPIHGSTTGMNYSINTAKNLFHCWRCGTGGDPLVFMAMKEGLISCKDAGPGILKNSDILKKLEEVILSGKYRQVCADRLKTHTEESLQKWKEEQDSFNSVDDRNQIETWINGRTLSAIVDEGILYNKDRDLILSSGKDVHPILRDICVSILSTGRNGNECISALATINKKLNPKLPSDELKKIREESYQVVKFLKLKTESALIDAAQVSKEIRDKAIEIVKAGKIREEFKKQYARIHASDEKIADIVLLGFCLQGLRTPDVIIHPVLDGERGAGKSSGIDAALHLLPQEYTDSSKQSVKALFYHTLLDKSVIYLDDNVWNEELGSFFKSYMNDVSKGVVYRTLDSDRKPVSLNFPLGCMLISSSVGDSGDDQLIDRQYRISAEKDPNKAGKHNSLILNELKTGISRRLFECEEFDVIREALRIFRRNEFVVILPDADKMVFSDNASPRDKEMFKVFLRAVVVLNHRQRTYTTGDDGVITVTSAGENFKSDFKQALATFDINKDKRQYRLSDAEYKVLKKIITLSESESHRDVSEKDICDAAGMSTTSVRNAIHGRNGIGGLLSKIPQMTVEKVSFRHEDSGKTVFKNILKLPNGFDINNINSFSFVSLNEKSSESPESH